LGCIVVTILNALISCKLCDILNHEIRPENIFINKSGQMKLAYFDKSRYLKELFETAVLKGILFTHGLRGLKNFYVLPPPPAVSFF
jgi:serine/threonine protein kinase